MAAARSLWKAQQGGWDHRHLVFLDETGLNTKMTRLYGRAPRSQRCLDHRPHGHWHTNTFIAALRHDRLEAPWMLDGAMNGQAFLVYVSKVLAPTLSEGDIVICDNLSSHKVAGVAEAIERSGATLRYLPAYSPDLNPIEMAFSKLKALVKKHHARSYDELFYAVAEAIESFPAEHCRGFFRLAQYATVKRKCSITKDMVLPDPREPGGISRIETVDAWKAVGRPATLELFRKHMFGRRSVERPRDLRFEVVSTAPEAIDGKATLKQIRIHYSGAGGKGGIDLAVFVPNGSAEPVPGFLLICNRDRENIDPTRKIKSPFWPVERIVERGYFAAAFHNSDLDPDEHDGFRNGVHGVFDPQGQERPADAWATIAAWAWGASRVMDYFETDDAVNEKLVAVVGHSRGGKTALWCGAEDERFAMAVSNNSGCSGAALSRRRKGETLKKINKRFPHWFCANYDAFNDAEETLPFDQHQLIALMAPRTVYVASATADSWADPKGEFLACVHAGPVYGLFGMEGVGQNQFPAAEVPFRQGRIGYHLRTGKHNLVEYDWKCFMDFADKHWEEGETSGQGID